MGLDDNEKCPRKQFTGTVDSDGISMCIHFKKPKKKDPPSGDEKIQLRDDDLVASIDPGGTDIMHVAIPTPTGKYPFKSVKLSRKQYYMESGISDARRHSNHWNMYVKTALKTQSEISTRGAPLDEFLLFMSKYLNVHEALWTEYTKPRWARQRLRLYAGKQRVFSRFFNGLESYKTTPTQRLVIAYGSGKFAPCGPGRAAAPVTRAYKECKNRFPTEIVDEFRSTHIDSQTGIPLKVVKSKEKGGKKVRGLLPKVPLVWCDSTNRQGGKFVNRDLNAAINIYKCFTLPTRPPELTRIPGQPRLDWEVGRTIKK